MVAYIRKMAVEQKHWLDEDSFRYRFIVNKIQELDSSKYIYHIFFIFPVRATQEYSIIKIVKNPPKQKG